MRRRLDIAGSLIVTPELIFLDEPTTGIDPRSRNQVWDIIRTLVDGGTTILLTTQYLEEADQLANRIAVIDTGKVIAEGTPAQLKSRVGSGSLRIHLADPARRSDAATLLERATGATVSLEADLAALNLQLSSTTGAPQALQTLQDATIEVESFSYGQPSLDEVFLTLTGQTTSDSTKAGA